MVTEEQIRFFDEQGYLNYGRVLEQHQVEELLDAMDRIVRIELEGGDDSSCEFQMGHRRTAKEAEDEVRTLTQYVNVWKRDEAYHRAIRSPLVTGIAKALLKTTEVRLWHDHIISNPPQDNAHFKFHQDFYNWPLSEPNILSCWIALDDATVDNGCMHVIPGSHRDPRFSPAAKQREMEAIAKDPQLRTDRMEMQETPVDVGVPVELKSGECMFHHSLNFHATPQNTTDRQRRAFVIIYMGKGVNFSLAQASTHVLVSLIGVEEGQPLEGEGFPRVA